MASTIPAAISSLSAHFWLAPWAQLAGLIALLIGVSAFMQKDDQKFRLLLSIFTLLMSLHFLLLNLWTAAISAFLGCLRNYVSMHTKSIKVTIIFLLVCLVTTIPNVSEPIHIAPIFGAMLGTWAVFREKGIKMRFLMFLGTLCWLSHNYLVGSIGGTIIESIFLIVNCRTMLKLLKESKTQC